LRKIWILVISAVVVFSSCLGITPQNGTVSGIVTDIAGNPLIGATVMIQSTSYGAMTDREGSFVISDIPIGYYTIVAQMVGMSAETRELDLSSFVNPYLSFSLEPAGYSSGPPRIKIEI